MKNGLSRVHRAFGIFILSGACATLPLRAGPMTSPGWDQEEDQEDTGGTTNKIVPIPGPQAYSSPTPVDAIVQDSDGNFQEQQYTYYPNYYQQDKNHPDPNVVIINNTNQVTGGNNQSAQPSEDSPSVFFPLFAMGFLFVAGYWVGHNGNCWNGHNYVNVHVNNWNSHWNHYWNGHWKNNWNQHWQNHSRNPNWRYRNNPNWNDQTGKHWKNSEGGGHAGGHAGGRAGGRGGGHR